MSFPDPDRLLDALAGTAWWALGIALAFHLVSNALRALAWRNILADDFREAPVVYRGILGAYVAGVGVNAVVPARVGDVLRLFLVHRQVRGATYPALISTLFVLALGDAVFALAFVLTAIAVGALPGLDVVVSDPRSVDGWVTEYPEATGAVAAVVVVTVALVVMLARPHLGRVKAGFARGFAVLRDWPFYPLHVLSWQGLAWACQLASFWWFMRAFGLAPSIADAAVVQAVQSLAGALPFTASGAGAEQALLLLVFAGQFAPAELFGFAFGMRATVIVVDAAIAAAVIFWLLRTFRWHRLVELEHELLAHVHLPRLVPIRQRARR